MAITFIDINENLTQASNLMEIGRKFIFTTINGIVKPTQIIEADGSQTFIGIVSPA